MANQRAAIERDFPASRTQGNPGNETRSFRFSAASFGAAVVQGACAFLMLGNSLKVALGIGSVTAARSGSLIHSDPVRLSLMVIAALGATFTLYVLWNGWRLRNRPEARWRRRPLTNRERWRIGIGLASSVLSWMLIIGEIYAHRIFHPK